MYNIYRLHYLRFNGWTIRPLSFTLVNCFMMFAMCGEETYTIIIAINVSWKTYDFIIFWDTGLHRKTETLNFSSFVVVYKRIYSILPVSFKDTARQNWYNAHQLKLQSSMVSMCNPILLKMITVFMARRYVFLL